MSYFGFLFRFLVPPLLTLGMLAVWDWRRGVWVPSELRGRPVWLALLAHIVVALLYTTPWDNYLVATRIWWYDPARVVGITLGWVPLEEYTFFVLQTLLTGLLWAVLARYLPYRTLRASNPLTLRWGLTAVVGLIWLGAIGSRLAGWGPGTYLALEFAWALPPIMLQLGFGADILWRNRRLVALSILIPTFYLSLADSTAIGAGTWTFDPDKSTGWWIGGLLPVEELFFFLLTNTLIGFGMTLVTSSESQSRVRILIDKLSRSASTSNVRLFHQLRRGNSGEDWS